MIRIISFLFLVMLIFSQSCSYDDEETYYDICDTLNVTFSQDVFPIINNNCTSCHSGVFAPKGIRLETYDDIKKVAENGLLLGVINHLPGYEPMPRGRDKLSDCSIAKIQIWINDSIPNN